MKATDQNRSDSLQGEHMKVSRRSSLMTALVISLLLSGCRGSAEDRAKFESARKENTVAAYQDYLAAHPDGRFVKQATEAVDSLNRAAFGQKAVQLARECKDYFEQFRSSNDKAPSGFQLLMVEANSEALTGDLNYATPEMAKAVNELVALLDPVVKENGKYLEELKKIDLNAKNFATLFRKLEAGAGRRYLEYWLSQRQKVIAGVDAFIAEAEKLPR